MVYGRWKRKLLNECRYRGGIIPSTLFFLEEMKMNRKGEAMEYLMTYGWVILVVMIVSVVMFQLGVFSDSSSSKEGEVVQSSLGNGITKYELKEDRVTCYVYKGYEYGGLSCIPWSVQK